MKISSWPLLILLAVPAAGAPSDITAATVPVQPDLSSGSDAQGMLDRLERLGRPSRAASDEEAKPKLDPKRIINESNSFLKEREPEMNAEEYAIYEKVVTMLSVRPAFALTMLEAMMTNQEPPSPAFEFILGNAYYSAGQFDKAETRYQSAVQRYPTFLRAWSNLGILYYSTQKYADAVRCLSQSVSLGDREPTTFGLLAYSLEQEGKIVPAEMAYMQAMSGDPSNGDWLEGLLRIYVQGKQFERAEWLVKDLIRQHPAESRFWLADATILMGENRKLEAIGVLETALGTGMAGPNELNLLADLYAEQKLVPEAIATYHRIMADTPDIGERKMLNLAQMLVSNGGLAEAQQVLDALPPRLTPAVQIDYLQTKSDVLAAKNEWPEARKILLDLLSQAPMNGPALLRLGHTYAAQDDLPRAALAYEEASQIPECTYRASLQLATIELKNRHYEKTVQYLEKALSIEKTPAVQDFLAHVKPLAAENELAKP